MKHVLFVAALIAGTAAMTGSAGAATIPKAYPGKNGLIAFDRSSQIYTISPTGSGLKKLTSNGRNYNPVWNPAGTKIAYEHISASGARNIWVMSANGSNKRQWTGTGTVWGSPAWSPSGKTLLFTNGGQWGMLETTSGTTPLQPRHALYGYNRDDNGNYTVLQGDNPSWTAGNVAFTASPYYSLADTCFPLGGSSEMGEECIDVYNTATKKFSSPQNTLGATQCPGYGGASVGALDRPRWAPDGSNMLYQYQAWNDDCTLSPWNVSGTYSSVISQPGDQQADYAPNGAYVVLVNALPGQKAQIIIESAAGSNRGTLTQGYEPNWQPVS